MRNCGASIVFVVLAVTVSAAPAQTDYYGGAYPVPTWQNRASTVGESHARGAADLVRAAGDLNLRNSQAAQNYEAARSQNLDNRLKYAETYYEKRRVRQEYMASQRKIPTKEQLYRRAYRNRPNRLTLHDLNPVTGEISWPVLLLTDDFADYRTQLQELFATRASQDHISYDTYEKIQQVGGEMDAKLDAMIKTVNSTDYIRANKFLESLLYEAKLMTS